MEFVPSIVALISALATAAYTFGAVRERIRDMERRLDKAENAAQKSDMMLLEIRDRVIAIDEWRKHLKA